MFWLTYVGGPILAGFILGSVIGKWKYNELAIGGVLGIIFGGIVGVGTALSVAYSALSRLH